MLDKLWNLLEKILPKFTRLPILVFIIFSIVLYGVYGFVNGDNITVVAGADRGQIAIVLIALEVFAFVLTVVNCFVSRLNCKKAGKGNDGEGESEGSTTVQAEDDKRIIETYLIDESNEIKRNSMFNEVNSCAHESYWALGTTLSFLASSDGVRKLNNYAKDNVKIRVCMLDAQIIIDDLCQTSFDKDKCALKSTKCALCDSGLGDTPCALLESGRPENSDDLLKVYRLLLNEEFLAGYANNIGLSKRNLEANLDSLNKVRNSCNEAYGKNCFELRRHNVLMPFSLTIADAESDELNGELVFEVKLPYKDEVIVLTLSERKDKVMFDKMVGFYNEIWEKSQDSQAAC